METIEKGFKYRIYPKNNQIEQIEIMFKAKRYVWNYFLNINKLRYVVIVGIKVVKQKI